VLERGKTGGAIVCPGIPGALAEIGIELVAVDHADMADIADLHADLNPARASHPGAPDPRLDLLGRDCILRHGVGRNGAAAGLGASLLVDQQRVPSAQGQPFGGTGAGRSTANDDHVIMGRGNMVAWRVMGV
jgi:hypothetical protein